MSAQKTWSSRDVAAAAAAFARNSKVPGAWPHPGTGQPRRLSNTPEVEAERREKELKDRVLVSITQVLDDPNPGAGEFDYSVPAEVMERFLGVPGNRAKLAAELRAHADRCERWERPYGGGRRN